ncbi:MAG: hypothetical protein ACLGJB_17755 [Blastocatellia bacterium]
MADEETVRQPSAWLLQGNKDGSLHFTIPSDRSEKWKREFERRWNNERKDREDSISPLGEVIINDFIGSVGITITSPMPNSDEWQIGIARRLMGILDKELNEPKDES